MVYAKNPPAATGNVVPQVQNAALFQGSPSDSKVYLYGGVTPTINTSFPNWQTDTTDQYTLWGLETTTMEWTQYDIFDNVPNRPSYGAYADAPDLGLGFYLNGRLTSNSEIDSEGLGTTVTSLNGLVVLDLSKQKVGMPTPPKTQPLIEAGSKPDCNSGYSVRGHTWEYELHIRNR